MQEEIRVSPLQSSYMVDPHWRIPSDLLQPGHHPNMAMDFDCAGPACCVSLWRWQAEPNARRLEPVQGSVRFPAFSYCAPVVVELGWNFGPNHERLDPEDPGSGQWVDRLGWWRMWAIIPGIAGRNPVEVLPVRSAEQHRYLYEDAYPASQTPGGRVW